MPLLRLQSSDGEIFPVDVVVARQSETLRTMMEHFGIDDNDEGDERRKEEEDTVPIANVSGSVLAKVIEWATHHKDDAPPPRRRFEEEEHDDDVPSWDAEFFRANQDCVYDLAVAANFLDIKGLLDMTLMTLANKIKGCKTREDYRVALVGPSAVDDGGEKTKEGQSEKKKKKKK